MNNNSAKLISLDFDDCLYDLMALNIKYVEDNFGIPNIHNKITSYYEIYNTYPSIGIDLWNNPDKYIQGKLVDNAYEFYSKLVKEYGVESIQIVTSSMENIIDVKNDMIKNRFGIDCDIKHSIFNKVEKHTLTNGTLLIDDHIGNIVNHLTNNSGQGIIFNHMDIEYIRKHGEHLANGHKEICYSNNFKVLFSKINNRLLNHSVKELK